MDFSVELWQSYQGMSHEELSAFIRQEFEYLLGTLLESESSELSKQETIQRVYRLSCVLWQSQETFCDLKTILREDSYDFLLDWTLNAPQNTECVHIKLAVDRVLCSVCSIDPDTYYETLLVKLGISCRNANQMYRFRHVIPGVEEMPDFDDVGDLDDEEPVQYQHWTHIDLSSVNLTENALKTLGAASLSYMTANRLINSKFLSVLIDSIVDFIINDENLVENMSTNSHESATKIKKCTAPVPSNHSAPALSSPELPVTNVETVVKILDLFTTLCWQNIVKIWLRSDRNTILWEHLLRYLCVRVPKSQNDGEYLLESHPSIASVQKLEESTIDYFSKCCSGRFRNQDKFSQIFYNVLSSEILVGSAKIGIPDFTRRILVEFIIMPQHVYISITTDLPEGMNKMKIGSNVSLYLPHPAFPTSERHQLLYMPVDYTCRDIVKKLKRIKTVEEEPKLDKEQDIKQNIEGTLDDLFAFSPSTSKEPPRSNSVLDELKIPQAKKMKVHNITATNDSATSEEQFYKLMLWDSNLYEYREIEQGWSIAQILQSLVPPEDELGVTVLKFSLLERDGSEKNENDENCTTYNLSAHSAIRKFVDLDGFTYVTLHMEKQERSNALQHIAMHTLLAFGHFIRLPEYQNNINPKSVLQAIVGSAQQATFIPGNLRHLFSSDMKNIHNPLMLLPFELLYKTISQIYKSSSNFAALDNQFISVIDFVLIYLAVCTHQPENKDLCAIDENKVYIKAVRQSYISRLRSKNENTAKTYWPSGTGYSSNSSVWYLNEMAKLTKSADPSGEFLQALEEEEIVTVILSLVGIYINPHQILHSPSYPEHKDEICSMSLSRSLPHVMIKQIKGSCLLNVIANYLKNDSVLDIVRHIPLYRAIMLVLRALVSNVQLKNLVLGSTSDAAASNDNCSSLTTLLVTLGKRIQDYLNKIKIGNKTGRAPSSSSKDNTDLQEQILLEDIRNTVDIIETMRKNLSTSEPTNQISPENAESCPMVLNDYTKVLKHLQFGEHEMITASPYHYREEVLQPMVTIPGRIKRLAMELTSLASSLPLSPESAIFVRHDSNRIDVMKALISGPPGTPYMNGLFEFDIFCPSTFPNEPIKVNFQTTGRGTVRFNPNLYDSGHVCLSILNTWDGEKWNPKTSSILQVLVSIQGMILVPEPYFNEPGYERHRETNRGDTASKAYNDNLLTSTIRYAMIEQISSTTSCFKEVIHAHFYLKRDEIKEQVTGWINECSGSYKTLLSTEAGRLFQVLDKLLPPSVQAGN